MENRPTLLPGLVGDRSSAPARDESASLLAQCGNVDAMGIRCRYANSSRVRSKCVAVLAQELFLRSCEGGVMLWLKAWLRCDALLCFSGGIEIWWCGLRPCGSTRRVQSGVAASRQWMGLQLGSVLLTIFTAIYLAGSGINSQTTVRRDNRIPWFHVLQLFLFRFRGGGCSSCGRDWALF